MKWSRGTKEWETADLVEEPSREGGGGTSLACSERSRRQGDWSGEREGSLAEEVAGRAETRQGALFWQEDPRLSRCEMKDGARPSGCGSMV